MYTDSSLAGDHIIRKVHDDYLLSLGQKSLR